MSDCIKGLGHSPQGVAEFDVWGVKIRPRRLQHKRKEQRCGLTMILKIGKSQIM